MASEYFKDFDTGQWYEVVSPDEFYKLDYDPSQINNVSFDTTNPDINYDTVGNDSPHPTSGDTLVSEHTIPVNQSE